MKTHPSAYAEQLARTFMERVWTLPHDVTAIDEMMTEDYVITSAGKVIHGREAFKAWVHAFHRMLPDATNQIYDLFANAAGDRVVCRWVCSGTNQGLFGLPPTGRPVSFSGIAIWSIRDGRLATCWVERSGLELYLELSDKAGSLPDEVL